MKCICKSTSRTLQVDNDIFFGEDQDGNLKVTKHVVEKSLLCKICGGRILEN